METGKKQDTGHRAKDRGNKKQRKEGRKQARSWGFWKGVRIDKYIY